MNSIEELAWTIAREVAGNHYGATPPVQVGNELPRDVGIIMKHIEPLYRRLKEAEEEVKSLRVYKDRMEWLHDCSTGDVDPEGFEWGIYRVKWENGKAAQVWQTNSDFSDLDAEIVREREACAK